MITIVDYDMGNVGSIKNMIKYLGFDDVEISNDKTVILNSTHLILPGVGSFDEGMKNLEERGLDKIIKKYALEMKKPLLGICLGMQLLGNSSDEGSRKGLGLVNFHNKRFDLVDNFKIPHMGWNTIFIKQQNNKVLKDLDNEYRFYFVHSYHAASAEVSNILLTAFYGYEFIAGVVNNNIYGVQFHPEKSHKFGMKLLSNFLELKNVQ